MLHQKQEELFLEENKNELCDILAQNLPSFLQYFPDFGDQPSDFKTQDALRFIDWLKKASENDFLIFCYLLVRNGNISMFSKVLNGNFLDLRQFVVGLCMFGKISHF